MTSEVERLDQYHTARSFKKGTCEVYQFHYEPMGWAFFYLHEFPNGGTLGIVSDWGNYSHMWGATGVKSLKHFLATCHAEYIVNKLSYEKGREFREQFDNEKTLINFKKRILEDRRDDRIDREEARDLWNDLVDWSPDGSAEEWYYTMPDSLSKRYPDPFEWAFVYATSPTYKYLETNLIPFFQRHLKKELGLLPKQEEVPSRHEEASV
jgi:hypothetical protein